MEEWESRIRWTNNEQFLTKGNLSSNLFVGGDNLVEHRSPIGAGMRPRQLHSPLGLPFGRQAPSLSIVFCAQIEKFAAKVQIN